MNIWQSLLTSTTPYYLCSLLHGWTPNDLCQHSLPPSYLCWLTLDNLCQHSLSLPTFFFLPWINTWQSLPTIIPSSYLCCILHGWTLDDLCRRRLRTLVLDLESCPELTPLTKCWSLDGSNRGGCRWDDHVCRREDELDLGTYSQPNRQRSICMDMEKNIYCILSSSWHPICFDVVVVDVFAVVGSNMPLITVWFFWNAT